MIKKIIGLVVAVTMLSGCTKPGYQELLVKKLEANGQFSQEQILKVKEWEVHENEEYGFSLVVPLGWEVIENISETERYISVVKGEDEAFVAIRALKDESLTEEGGLEKGINKREAEMKGSSEYVIDNFLKQMKEDKTVAGYMAVGKMNLAKMNEELMFEERGMMDVYGKVILMHGASQPELVEDYMWQMRVVMESFSIGG